jgi:hypothetical protein
MAQRGGRREGAGRPLGGKGGQRRPGIKERARREAAAAQAEEDRRAAISRTTQGGLWSNPWGAMGEQPNGEFNPEQEFTIPTRGANGQIKWLVKKAPIRTV